MGTVVTHSIHQGIGVDGHRPEAGARVGHVVVTLKPGADTHQVELSRGVCDRRPCAEPDPVRQRVRSRAAARPVHAAAAGKRDDLILGLPDRVPGSRVRRGGRR